MSWPKKSCDNATISGGSRIRAIYGEEPTVSRETAEERAERARVNATREPWGMSIVRYPNPNIAKVGPYEARRPRSGGPWTVRAMGALLVSESLEDLFLQLTEKIDETRRDQDRPVHYYAPPSSAARNRCGMFPESAIEEGSIIYIPGSKGTRLPSERFYKR